MSDENSTIFGLTLRRLKADASKIPSDMDAYRLSLTNHILAFRRAQEELGPIPVEPVEDISLYDRFKEIAYILSKKYKTDLDSIEDGPILARFAQEMAGLTRILLTGEIEEQRGINFELTELTRLPKSVYYPNGLIDQNTLKKLIIARGIGHTSNIALQVAQRQTEEQFPRPADLEYDPEYMAIEACMRVMENVDRLDPQTYTDETKKLNAAVQAAYVAYVATLPKVATNLIQLKAIDKRPDEIFYQFIRDAWPKIESILATKYKNKRTVTASGRSDPAHTYPSSWSIGFSNLMSSSPTDETSRLSTKLLQDKADYDRFNLVDNSFFCNAFEYADSVPPQIKVWTDIKSMQLEYSQGSEDGMIMRIVFSKDSPDEKTVDILIKSPVTFFEYKSFEEYTEGISISTSPTITFNFIPVYITENPNFSFFDPDSDENRWIIEEIADSEVEIGTIELTVDYNDGPSRKFWTVTDYNALNFLNTHNFFADYVKR